MPELHEVLKMIDDLAGQGELELACGIAELYAQRLDNNELRYRHLLLLLKGGNQERAFQLLEKFLETNRWFSRWFLTRNADFESIRQSDRFEAILNAADEREGRYWLAKVMQPITQVPTTAKPPYPMLVALHGNGYHSQHSSEGWSCAVEQGWLVFHPLSKRLVGYGLHWWDDHDETRRVVTDQVEEILPKYPVDPRRILLGGFSKGGEAAMVLAMAGVFSAQGFITVGAGGYLHLQPDLWKPILKNVPKGLRGVAMYSPYDLGRVSPSLDSIFSMMRGAGIGIRLEIYPAEGHVFPADFSERFRLAVRYIFEGLS